MNYQIDLVLQKMATVEAAVKNLRETLDEYTHEHITNIYEQIADTDDEFAKFKEEIRDIANAVRNQK